MQNHNFCCFLDVLFLYFLCSYYATTVGLVNISSECFHKMLNDALDKIVYWLMIKEMFWHDLNPSMSLVLFVCLISVLRLFNTF